MHSERDIEFKRHLIKLAGRTESRCVGVGIEQFESMSAERSCAKFLNECGFIGVRDKQSFEVAKAIAPNANIELTFDLAPVLLCHQKHKIVPIERKGIMFNFCRQAVDAFGNVNEAQEKKRIQAAAIAIEKVWEETKEPITLLDFNGHSVFGDQHIHEQIISKLAGHIPVSHIAYDPNPFRVLQRIAGFKASVVMRLHAGILSFMAGTPSLSLNYHPKCWSWCNQAGVADQYQFDSSNFCPEILADGVIKGVGTGFALPTLTIHDAVTATLKNWRQSNEYDAVHSCNSTLQQS